MNEQPKRRSINKISGEINIVITFFRTEIRYATRS
ncbi:Uncharacterised protein [Clostridioides difficile]|nr:Uncharacterised protein [Clostridioides difficile]